ncbi:MAG: phosphate acyltransferase PlsX [Mogibacterium sp.]|nr:phosphate acyltransferase PlsX [Mogibacterium sp.]
MNILIDGMGGDNSPVDVIKGAMLAAKQIDETISIIGPKERICTLLAAEGCQADDTADVEALGYVPFTNKDGKAFRVYPASDIITNNEAPAMAVRKHKDSTIVRGISLVKSGEADIFLSAGSTGALLTGSLLILGRIKGVKRPGIATFFPKIGQNDTMLIVDVGASVDPKPEYLLQFGIMGSIFVNLVKGVENPAVMMLNVGAEAEKGDEVHKEAYRLLMDSSLNFLGNVEGRDVPFGPCDVVVTDGFAGNIFLKTAEGVALVIMKTIKQKLTETTAAKLGALLAKNKLYELKSELNYSEEGGAPILGVNGAVLKVHGNSKAEDFCNAILKAVPYVNHNVTRRIAEAILANKELQGAQNE